MRSLTPASPVPAAIAEQWPVWLVAVWGFALAGLAGFINAHAFLTAFEVPVSHMSGTATHLGIFLGRGDFSQKTLVAAAILLSFFGGAVLSGAIIGHRVLLPGRRYGLVLALEGVMILVSAWMLGPWPMWSTLAVAAACGLQNGMASSYLGLVLRTTHVTGIVTDLGIMVGYWLRGHRPSLGKLGVLAGILAGFLGGGVLAAFLLDRLRVDPLRFLGGALVAIGLAYYAYRVWLRRKLGVRVATLGMDE